MYFQLFSLYFIFHVVNCLDVGCFLYHPNEIGKCLHKQCSSWKQRTLEYLEEAKRYVEKSSCEGLDSQAAVAVQSKNTKPIDCSEIKKRHPYSSSGIYEVWPQSEIFKDKSISVYCDMDDDGGGWTVLQRRDDFGKPKDYFYKNWTEYKHGFGDLNKDFWLGNDKICALTNQNGYTLKFDLADWEGEEKFEEYIGFRIEDESEKYALRYKEASGTAGDSLDFMKDMGFSTQDQDNDLKDSEHCAQTYQGAWWYSQCHSSNLNGLYLKGKTNTYANGVTWSTWKGQEYSLKRTVMKIRPILYKKHDPISDSIVSNENAVREDTNRKIDRVLKFSGKREMWYITA